MNRKFDNVAQFAEHGGDITKQFVDRAEDYVKHYTNENFGTKFAVETMGASGNALDLNTKAKQLQELFVKEVESRSGVAVSDMNNDFEQYATLDTVQKMAAMLKIIMVDVATPILIDASGLNMLAEFHYGGYGDIFKFELQGKGYYDVSKMGRRQKHTKVQDSKRTEKTIATEMYGLTTIATLPQILQGKAMIAEDAMKAALSINKKVYTLVVKKFVEAADAMNDARFTLANYTEKSLLEKLGNGSAFNGSKMTIIGDVVPLKDLLPASQNNRIYLNDEFNKELGYMDEFNTYPVIGFGTVYDKDEENGVLRLPLDKIYGISLDGSKLIHVALGSTSQNTDDMYDNNNLSILSTLRKEIGVELATMDKIVKCTME